ncbi:MAG: hypothetical protein M1830_009993 [Pleopsidium flavum]|nr:MAG: hypothetical protein M1830_009993 [Pleopsidium flavum]
MASSAVHVNGSFDEPVAAQHDFPNQYDDESPLDAITDYARVMHQHTKRQMDIATRSSRRRSPEGAQATSTRANEWSQSSRSSLDSGAS